MKAVPLSSGEHLAAPSRPGLLDGIGRRAVHDRLKHLQRGTLVLCDGGERRVFGGHESADPLTATLVVNDPRFYGDVAFGGTIGAGEAWMRGDWDCDDLVALVRIMIRNRDLLESLEGGLAALGRPMQKLLHWINRNTRSGAERNIAAHYDLGNDFFGLWLDESMMYSCALFEREDATLAEAQQARLERVCERLELQSGDHLIEIGTGWGGLAIFAASRYGCRVTTTTISKEQYALANERVLAAGLSGRITVLLDDYRDLTGSYDKLVSLEMIEAIGHAQHAGYFRKCAELLRPGGRMLVQAITIDDERFDEYRHNVDFIQRYIFPGSCLPSKRVMRETIARETDMRITSIDEIGPHYATTLEHWRRNFTCRRDEILAMGYEEAFLRMWEFYFCYCEGGFLERSIGDVLLVAERPDVL